MLFYSALSFFTNNHSKIAFTEWERESGCSVAYIVAVNIVNCHKAESSRFFFGTKHGRNSCFNKELLSWPHSGCIRWRCVACVASEITWIASDKSGFRLAIYKQNNKIILYNFDLKHAAAGQRKPAAACSADGKHFLVFQHHMLISVRASESIVNPPAWWASVFFYSSILISILRFYSPNSLGEFALKEQHSAQRPISTKRILNERLKNKFNFSDIWPVCSSGAFIIRGRLCRASCTMETVRRSPGSIDRPICHRSPTAPSQHTIASLSSPFFII